MMLVITIAIKAIPEKKMMKDPTSLAKILKIVAITSSIVDPILVAPFFAVFAIFS